MGVIALLNLTVKTGKVQGWELAIERANSHLQKNRVQAARLRAAIRLFEEKAARNEPWPEERAATS
jgi:hypothetical protein